LSPDPRKSLPHRKIDHRTSGSARIAPPTEHVVIANGERFALHAAATDRAALRIDWRRISTGGRGTRSPLSWREWLFSARTLVSA